MINGIEAVADAILQFEGYFSHNRGVPSRAYQLRNPGNLRDLTGQYATFADFVSGYNALLRDLRAKFTAGANRHGLGPNSALIDLFAVYAPSSDHNPTVSYCNFVAAWVTMVTGKSVAASTRLGDIWRAPGQGETIT